MKIRPWLRRLITRCIAIMPAAGDDGTKLLVYSQVILSIQLPFAIIPLVGITSHKDKTWVFLNNQFLKLIQGCNNWLDLYFGSGFTQYSSRYRCDLILFDNMVVFDINHISSTIVSSFDDYCFYNSIEFQGFRFCNDFNNADETKKTNSRKCSASDYK